MKITSLGPFSVTEQRPVPEDKKKSGHVISSPTTVANEVGTDTSVQDESRGQPRLGKVLDLIEEAQKRAQKKKKNLSFRKRKALFAFTRAAKKEEEKDYKGLTINVRA